MKTVTGRVINEEPISLSKAATILSRFVSSENGASQDVSAYLRRASAAFTELKSFHKDINTSSLKETNPSSDAGKDRNPTGEFDEICRVKGVDDLVEKRGKIFRKSETVREEESIHGREQDEIKEDMKKNKNKKNKENDVLAEKVKEKLEDEQTNEERKKEKKKTTNKNKNKEDVDQKVNEKLEEDQRNEERKKEKKKKRKRDGEIGSEERKSKKKKKSKEIDG